MANKRNLIGFGILAAAGLAAAAFAAKASASISDSTGTTDGTAPAAEGITQRIFDFMTTWKSGEYPKYASAIRDAEARYDIQQDLLARLLYQESHFRADIIAGTERSPVGAVGIAQFMPATAKQYGLILGDGTDNRTDPFASIDAAGRYLHALYGMFGDWNSAIMAYNWGPGNVAKYNRGESVTVPIETSQYLAQITADVPLAA